MESYFRIGEISSIFNIPLQTLRYYDKISSFSPVYTNQETGYRYYSLYQLPLLHQIKTFKNMGIPFSEIKELTSTDGTSIKWIKSMSCSWSGLNKTSGSCKH
ncbi:MerR family transcriptional regulator [Paenibacillus larvae]|uniref:MerR family transcriptional regulator n=1 Tax=Paenibacillus larvae TaxID=1464 RepID=UPI0022803E83|nr:MerR family transcriptional regulator [Paenibacillus larvae]MCY9510028.1 MerR family transcriptional regulator [Paenibacillus larvae]MCY9527315.1 MerR family transcriptional regulator [Paenibacillus larvae]